MSTPVLVGNRIENIDLLEMLPPDEGEIDQYYGRIGSGKTYAATVDVIKDLERGQVVYTNWSIIWNGYDERSSRWKLLLGFLRLKRHFYYFPRENLKYFPVKDSFTDDLGRLNDCKIYLDEGHIPFDSYATTRMSLEKRAAVLHTRHYNRTIVVISQRPSAIHVTLRANVNRFYKCEKTINLKLGKLLLLRFLKTEFQDTRENDTPDETRVLDPETHEDTKEYKFAISSKHYWGRKIVFKKYDTKYLRTSGNSSQVNAAEIYSVRSRDCLRKIFSKRLSTL